MSYNETPGNEGSRWWHIGREISLRYESSVIQMGSPPSRAEVRQAEENRRAMYNGSYPVRLETVIDILASYNSISQGERLRAQELPEHIRLDERALGDMGIVLMSGLLGPEECEEEGRLCWHVATHKDDDSSQMGRIVAWELSSGEAFVEFWLGECPDVRMFYETRERIDQDIEYTAAIIVRKLGYKSGLEVAVEATLEELDRCLREFHSARSEKGWCWSTDPTTGAPVFTRLALCPGGVVFEGGHVWCVEAPNICSDAGSAAQFCTIGAGPLPGLGDGLSVICWPDWNKEETPVSYRQYVGELMSEFQRRAIIRDLPAWLTEPEHTEPSAAAGEDTGNLAAEQGQTEPAPTVDGAGGSKSVPPPAIGQDTRDSAPEQAQMEPTPSTEAGAPEPKQLTEDSTDTKPWERVPEIGYDRLIIKLLHAGYTSRDIGDRLDRRAHTIENRITELRKRYGEEIVPRRRRRRKPG